MDRQISTLYYERLLASREKESVVVEAEERLKEVAPTQFIHDPFVLEFLNLNDYPALRESEIEQALIDHLQQFLLLKCHVLIDLKLGKLTHEDVGQMDSYIRMYDDLYKPYNLTQ